MPFTKNRVVINPVPEIRLINEIRKTSARPGVLPVKNAKWYHELDAYVTKHYIGKGDWVLRMIAYKMTAYQANMINKGRKSGEAVFNQIVRYRQTPSRPNLDEMFTEHNYGSYDSDQWDNLTDLQQAMVKNKTLKVHEIHTALREGKVLYKRGKG